MKFLFRQLTVGVCAASSIVLVVTAATAHATQTAVMESWESYSNNITPYGSWNLDAIHKCQWGTISDNGLPGGKCYWVDANVKSRLLHEIDLSAAKDIVLQGWIYDSGVTENKGAIGFLDTAQRSGNSLIRIGAIGGSHRNYMIAYYDPLQAKASLTLDTGMRLEKGWHFMRLDIGHDRTVTYRIWNAAQTAEKKGNFVWVFDKAKLTQIIVGSVAPSPGPMGYDDIKVGDSEQIGPPPSLPTEPVKDITATNSTP